MTQPRLEQVYSRLTQLLRDVFDSDTLVATPTLKASDVEGWDSMGNVNLFLAIEEEFRVRFSTPEIAQINDVGELAKAISEKQQSSNR